MGIFRLVLSIRPAVNILRSYYITIPTLNQRKGEKEKKKKKGRKPTENPDKKGKSTLMIIRYIPLYIVGFYDIATSIIPTYRQIVCL